MGIIPGIFYGARGVAYGATLLQLCLFTAHLHHAIVLRKAFSGTDLSDPPGDEQAGNANGRVRAPQVLRAQAQAPRQAPKHPQGRRTHSTYTLALAQLLLEIMLICKCMCVRVWCWGGLQCASMHHHGARCVGDALCVACAWRSEHIRAETHTRTRGHTVRAE
jgi:hypothetical protein